LKKKIIAFAALVLCMTVFASSTLAYFTKDDVATNVFTTGGIDIQVVEQQLQNGVLVDYPTDKIHTMPGCTVSKIVTVKNIEEPAFIRAKFTVAIINPDGDSLPVDVVDIAVDPSVWREKDGWYYYIKPSANGKGVVATGEVTEAFFEEVVFDGPGMDNTYRSSTITIDVQAEAVQTANNIPSSGNPYDAGGWAI